MRVYYKKCDTLRIPMVRVCLERVVLCVGMRKTGGVKGGKFWWLQSASRAALENVVCRKRLSRARDYRWGLGELEEEVYCYCLIPGLNGFPFGLRKDCGFNFVESHSTRLFRNGRAADEIVLGGKWMIRFRSFGR
ncbi:hypothetical protein TNIN_3181 [Trichonephila inaurata madagascariensis]|uniref:Uncharacterized protein n=1 Tax=Trichonephila inaurata madagascariensis TaxID=2747483 RepID=A0A8X6XP65_9ARAC|nr:hypothetical protein TNIN_3181 [Trichonephila inaurata madagascariensis]